VWTKECAQAGAIPAFLSAMNAQTGNARVQRWGATALRGMSADDKSARQAIGRAGGIQVLVRALQMHLFVLLFVVPFPFVRLE
jgi:hypothetical protein